jgi:O-antigen ligase
LLLNHRAFEIGRPILYLYGLVAIGLSAALLLQSRQRGPGEMALWLVAYASLAIGSLWKPHLAPLVGGSMAFLLGIVKTHCAGPNLDLGLSLITFSVGVFVLDQVRRGSPRSIIDPAGLALLVVAVLSLVSLTFAIPRIRGFVPAPGFDYHAYPFNALRFSSDEAIVRATIGATAMFSWFGLYEFARSRHIARPVLATVVTGLLLINSLALFVQQHVDPSFLLHAGRPIGRLNGVTSYCYALGDAALALFLLLPAWGSSRGRAGLLTAANLALLWYAVSASGSRTALLVILMAALLWTVWKATRLFRTRQRLIAGASLGTAALVLTLGAWVYHATPADLVSPIGRLKFGVERDGLVGHLVTTRLSSYALIGRVLAAYPLSGVGAGLYLAEVSKQHELLAPDVEILEPYLLSSFAPNQFLNTAVELGLPALMALATVFVFAGASAWSRRKEPRSANLAISLLALVVALQLGPSFYTSEALVFFWLIVGLSASATPGRPPDRLKGAPLRATPWLLACAGVLGIGGQLLALPTLGVEAQWQRLRWPITLGMHRPEEGGRWTRPQATFMADPPGRELELRWHVGDVSAPEYRARVSFFVDGQLVEESVVGSGPVRQSTLPLPAKTRPVRVSVRVEPPFIPGPGRGGPDPRRLGIFIHDGATEPR